jgi:molecular chaperone GrpE
MAKKDTQPDQEAPKEEQPQQPTRQQELTDQLQRLQAEFANYRKRIEAEQQYAAERGQEKIVKEVLSIVDSMELAIKHHTNDNKQTQELLKGLELIYSQLLSALENWGVERIPADGLLDPRLHEVYITETRDDVPSNTILETLQHGYMRHGTVLRTAKVKAARKA